MQTIFFLKVLLYALVNALGSVCLVCGSQMVLVVGEWQKVEGFGSLGCLSGHFSEKSSL